MAGVQLDRPLDLHEPVMVAAFSGWNDAGEAATAAVRWLVRRLPAQRIGVIDPELYHDFTETRPTVRQVSGERRISWPAHDLFAAANRERPSDIVLLVAREPELRWRTYCQDLVAFAREAGARQIVTLGAFLGETPHNRTVPVTGFATTAESLARVDRLGLGLSSYAGPTGVTAVLNQIARENGLDSASLWAAVPRYLPTTANPKAALALARTVLRLLEIELDLRRLENAAVYFERQVDEAIARDRRATNYIRELERRSDSGDDADGESGSLPSAEDVIHDLEEFLRNRATDGNADG